MSYQNKSIIALNSEAALQECELINAHFPTIKILASALNRADLLQIQGLYRSNSGSNQLGLEFSGITEDNQLVCGLVDGGAHSNYLQADPRILLPVPKNIDPIVASALPETLASCWLNLFELGKLEPGCNVLIHGGSSGIGSMAIQIAKAFNCTVFTSVGDDSKKNACEKLGADYVFNYTSDDYVSAIKNLNGCDLILDILGGEHLPKAISILNQNGRLISIAAMQGGASEIKMGSVLIKNLTIIGSTLRNKSIEKKSQILKEVQQHFYPLIEIGAIKPVIDSIYEFEAYKQAFAKMESRSNFGKIILKR